MKKAFVVIFLFVLPIVAYLFFSSGVNKFSKLPILEEEIGDLQQFESLSGEKVDFQENISILGFFGKDIEAMAGHAFNLNQKIYKPYHKFKDFQFVIVLPNGTQEEVKTLMGKLDNIVDVRKWKFVFGDEKEVKEFYNSLNAAVPLNNKLATPYVYIVDKKGRLRGRDDADADVVIQGYDTGSVAELNNKMDDDVKVVLAEYRLALKKYNKNEK